MLNGSILAENKDKDEIGECKGEMMVGWKKLLDACDKREELLKDAMEAAEYLDSSTQAQQWVDVSALSHLSHSYIASFRAFDR